MTFQTHKHCCRGQESWCRGNSMVSSFLCTATLLLFRLTSCCGIQRHQIHIFFLSIKYGTKATFFLNRKQIIQKPKKILSILRERDYMHTHSMYAPPQCNLLPALPAAEPSSKLVQILDCKDSLASVDEFRPYCNLTCGQTYHWAQCWQCAEQHSRTEDHGFSPAAAPPEVWWIPNRGDQWSRN